MRTKLNSFQKIAVITVMATLFLIIVGGLVRAAGAGLGCPDWPRCFGAWMPPTTASDLPPEYDPSRFNLFKAWLEYINRLIGVVIGFLITATFIKSFRYRKTKPVIFHSALWAFLLVGFQGWLGGQVVKTELKEWVITVHMILALVIVNLLIFAAFKAFATQLVLDLPEGLRKKLLLLGGVILFVTLVQVSLGTQVREGIDFITNNYPDLERELWIEQTGTAYGVHRSFSWIVFLASLALFYVVRKGKLDKPFWVTSDTILGFVILQMLLGAGLAYLAVPPTFQVLHLFNTSVMVCAEFLFVLFVFESRPHVVNKI